MALLLWLPIGAALFLAVWLAVKWTREAASARSMGCLPAPIFRPWDVLGIQNMIIEIGGVNNSRLSHAFTSRKKEMSDKVGRNCTTFIVRYPPGERWIYVFCPKNLQAILATQFNDFQQPKARIDAFQTLLGEGIFSTNGPKWEHSRALLRPQFMREQIADLDLFERHVLDLFNALPIESGWTPVLDMQPLLASFTMDTASEFLFGESVYSLKSEHNTTSTLVSKQEMRNFVDAFFAAQKTMAKSMFLVDLYWLMQNKKFKEQCKVVHAFVDTYVQRRLKSDTKPSGKYVVLDAIVADFKDPHELRSQLLGILLAGSDTVSGALGFLLATLAKHPQVFQKLRKIVLEDFGTFERPKSITLSGLKACSYLQYTINEVLRVYPVVPVNFKEAVRDTSLPVGGGPDGLSPVFVPRGTLVAWELWTMHSDPEFWGSDASEFKPERWAGRKYGFDYLPFNAGPRICIGQNFALAEVAYVTVRMLQKFDAIDGSALPEGRLPCDWKLVDKVAGGVNIRLHTASTDTQ